MIVLAVWLSMYGAIGAIASNAPSLEISYVVEPFEAALNGTNATHFALDEKGQSVPVVQFDENDGPLIEFELANEDALFGESSLVVTIGASLSDTYTFGNIVKETEPAHNCIGATHLSLWYKSLNGTATMSIYLLDDSDCLGCTKPADLRQFRHIHAETVEPKTVHGANEWNELRIEMPIDGLFNEFWSPMDIDNGNGGLRLDHIRGWAIGLSHNKNGNRLLPIVVMIDQLACVGGGDLLGAALKTTDSLETAESTGAWKSTFYYSDMSKNQSTTTLADGFLGLHYFVEQRETWGGFISHEHRAPANAYYNLSTAAALTFNYNVTKQASVLGRAHLRLILQEVKGCTGNCRDKKQQELFYSFHYVLDSLSNSAGEVSVDLEGDKDWASPFTFTGWDGTKRNGILDPSSIKGFDFELFISGDREIGSYVQGAVSVSNLSASMTDSSEKSLDSLCVIEPALHAWEGSHVFKRHYFVNNCCERCDADEECMYALFSVSDCLTASYLGSDTLVMANTPAFLESSFYVKTSAAALGDFCTACNCRQKDRTIDCRDSNLRIVPKTFSPSESESTWAPLILDLSGNPRLRIVAEGALDSISDSLQELILPISLQFFAPGHISGLRPLTKVRFEGVESFDMKTKRHLPSNNVLKNAIAGLDDFFGDICCGLGDYVAMDVPSQGFTFCNMQIGTIGGDTVYEPFVSYFQPGLIEALKPSSLFMAEAAESAEKCAEYCKGSSTCRFFEYDQRVKEAEHTCRLLASNGTPTVACCQEYDYMDVERTQPGLIGGRPPRTRHDLDNARVLVAPLRLKAEELNGYEGKYQVSLGSTPLRGAVWIEPRLASSTSMKVLITPPRVVLYNNATSAVISVRISNVDAGLSETLILLHSIEACDEAFTYLNDGAETQVYFHVVGPSEPQVQFDVLVGCLLAFCLLFAVLVYFLERRRRQSGDAIWTIQPSELHFCSPPKVLGQGTFGVVLLAEYRGTPVAVKRVLPVLAPSKKLAASQSTTSTYGISMEPCSDLESCGAFDGVNAPESDHTGTKTIGLSTLRKKHNSGSSSGSLVFKGARKHDVSKLKADFIVEMRTISKLRHPCVTTVIGAIVSKKEDNMLVMEYMEHGSLYDVLHNDTVAIEGELLLPILRDVAHGLRFLHASSPQIVHGDIKAANILVDRNFRAKVADFGLSQKRRMNASGSPFWMAPELLRGESENTSASDAYSFGVVLFEVYSREDPYKDDEEDGIEILRHIADPCVNKRPPIPEACPIKVQSLMTDCLSADPEERPTFEELDLQLKRLNFEKIEPSNVRNTVLDRTDALMDTIYPPHVARALRSGKKVESEKKEIVSIFYSKICDFNKLSCILGPAKIANLLQRLYTVFDRLLQQFAVFKLQTIGDAYMAVTNLVSNQPNDHVKRIAQFAAAAVKVSSETLIDLDAPSKGYVKIRCAIHSGSVITNVVGTICPRFCLFGNVVTATSRLESSSEGNRIHCSERSAMLLKQQCPEMLLYERGLVSMARNSKMLTFWVNETKLDSMVAGMGSLHSLGPATKGKRNKKRNQSTNPSLPAIPDEDEGLSSGDNRMTPNALKTNNRPTFDLVEHAGTAPTSRSSSRSELNNAMDDLNDKDSRGGDNPLHIRPSPSDVTCHQGPSLPLRARSKSCDSESSVEQANPAQMLRLPTRRKSKCSLNNVDLLNSAHELTAEQQDKTSSAGKDIKPPGRNVSHHPAFDLITEYSDKAPTLRLPTRSKSNDSMEFVAPPISAHNLATEEQPDKVSSGAGFSSSSRPLTQNTSCHPVLDLATECPDKAPTLRLSTRSKDNDSMNDLNLQNSVPDLTASEQAPSASVSVINKPALRNGSFHPVLDLEGADTAPTLRLSSRSKNNDSMDDINLQNSIPDFTEVEQTDNASLKADGSLTNKPKSRNGSCHPAFDLVTEGTDTAPTLRLSSRSKNNDSVNDLNLHDSVPDLANDRQDKASPGAGVVSLTTKPPACSVSHDTAVGRVVECTDKPSTLRLSSRSNNNDSMNEVGLMDSASHAFDVEAQSAPTLSEGEGPATTAPPVHNVPNQPSPGIVDEVASTLHSSTRKEDNCAMNVVDLMESADQELTTIQQTDKQPSSTNGTSAIREPSTHNKLTTCHPNMVVERADTAPTFRPSTRSKNNDSMNLEA